MYHQDCLEKYLKQVGLERRAGRRGGGGFPPSLEGHCLPPFFPPLLLRGGGLYGMIVEGTEAPPPPPYEGLARPAPEGAKGAWAWAGPKAPVRPPEA